MNKKQPLSRSPYDQFTQNIQTFNLISQAVGFLDALSTIAKLPPITGHPLELETLDRIYFELERGYSKRFKGAQA